MITTLTSVLVAYISITALIFFFANGVVYPNWSLRAAFKKNNESLELLQMVMMWPSLPLLAFWSLVTAVRKSL